MDIDREQLAWAAGFFVGEGNFGNHKGNSSPVVNISQLERAPLDRFNAATGDLGTIYAYEHDFNRNGNQLQMHRYRATSFEKCQAIAAMLWPWLSPWKQNQALAMLGLCADKLPASRIKTYCIRGHALIPENIYLYKGTRSCRECKRVRYHLAKI